MDLTYFKRYRMEISLPGRNLQAPVPDGYRLRPWDPSLLEEHARAKYQSFCGEIDAVVFPCLGELNGCRRLMNEISRKPGFLPETTWLVECLHCVADRHGVANGQYVENDCAGNGRSLGYCGTVQGIRDRQGLGSIQNLGIVPEHRDAGLGTALLFAALRGFREAGLDRVYLEVTAQNQGAIRLYRRLGFQVIKTVYKAVEVAYS